MSVVPSSAFAMRDNNSVSGKTTRLVDTEAKAASVLEIKFIGIAVERCGIVAGADYWIVNVEELISGPPWSGKLTVYTINIFADSPIWGHADPDITVGDKVEVYGKCKVGWGVKSVTLNGNENYYIKKTDGTTKCGKITNWKTACTNVQLGGKFGAEMDFDNLMAGGYRFKGIVRVRSPTGVEYSGENQPRFVSSSPNNHGKFAGGNTLYVRIPEGAATGKYDVKLELWNVDTNELCDDTGWKENIFTVKDGGTVSEIVFTGTAIEYFSRIGAWGWTVRADEIISGPLELQGHTLTAYLASVNPDEYPYGYIDPNIEPEDKVEVYGWYQGEDNVALFGSKDYYIKRKTPINAKITKFDVEEGTKYPGNTVGAQAEISNEGDTYTFRIEYAIRDSKGAYYVVYDENVEILKGASLTLDEELDWSIPYDIAEGECWGRLVVSDPNKPSTYYDIKWDFDAFKVIYSAEEIKFKGTALEYYVSGGQIHYWVVRVDKIISGPPPCADELDVTVYDSEIPPPWGYVDPNLNVGDQVEVYGRYYDGHCSAMHLYGSAEYYIKRDKKADLTFKEFYFTVDSNEITGAKPGQKVSAHLTLLNKGGKDVDKTKVELYIKKEGKDELLASREITNIASGTLGVGFAIPFEAPLSYGIYDIYAMVDPEGLIEEEDENNNKILRILRVNMVQGKVVILPNNYCYLYPVEIIFESKTSGEKYSAFAPYGLYEIYVPPSEYTAYAKPTDNIFLKPKPKNVITPPDTEVDLPVIFNRDIKFKEGEISLESIKENYPDIYNWLENNYELDNEKIKIAGGTLVFEGDIEKYRLKVAEFVIDGIGYVLLVAALIKEVPVIVSVEAFLMVAGKETVKEIPKEMLKILGKNIATGGWPDPSDLSTPDPEGNIYEFFVTTLNKDEDIIRTHLFYLNKYAKWEHIHSQKHKYSISDSNVVLQGKVVDDENNALDGVLVEVIQSHGSLLAKAKTDASGAYKLTIPLIIGEYEDEFLIDLKPVKSVHGIVRLSKEGYKTEEIEETFEMGVYNKNFKLEKETENNIIKGHVHLVLPPMDRRTNVFAPTIMLSADGALYKPYINPTLNDGYYEFHIGKQHNKIALTASVYSASPDMVCDEKSIEVNIGSDPSPITKEIDFDMQCYCTVPLEYQEWKLNSPGNLHIYDLEGRHVGINTSTGCVDTEIPNVVYSGPEAYPQTASIFNLSSELRLIFEGTEEGSFDLIGKKKSDEKKRVEFRHVITSFSTRAELNIGPNSNYKMRIDTNNDGHMDFERKPDLVNTYPVGSYISREKSIVKQTITFDASQSYDLDGGIVEHEWDFGDGSTGTGKIITHSYSSAGNYTVELTVTDNDGATDTIAATITVLLLPALPVHNINKGTDYATIQEAINEANMGDEIHVDTGTYYENVVVDKQLSLKGIGMPAVDANGSGNCMTVHANNVCIKGFVIRNSGPYDFNSGIYLVSANDCTIFNNIVVDNRWGISASRSCENKIADNELSNNFIGIVIIFSSSNNSITNNILSLNSGGFYLQSSSNYNTISFNTITSNNDGIGMHDCNGNWIINNEISNSSTIGFRAVKSDNNKIYHNNLINNANQAYDDGTNSWDNGYPSGGNYWSDYIGVDLYHGLNQNIPGRDGIGDIPYNIAGGAGALDKYPLMIPTLMIPI